MATYDPKSLLVTFGPLPIFGFADGEMVKVEYQGEGDKTVVGTAGETARIRNHDRRAKVTVRIMSTRQEIVAALQAHYVAGNPQLPLVISSGSTGSVHASGDACLEKQPDEAFGAEVPIREFVFACERMGNVVSPV